MNLVKEKGKACTNETLVRVLPILRADYVRLLFIVVMYLGLVYIFFAVIIIKNQRLHGDVVFVIISAVLA